MNTTIRATLLHETFKPIDIIEMCELENDAIVYVDPKTYVIDRFGKVSFRILKAFQFQNKKLGVEIKLPEICRFQSKIDMR